MVEHEVIEKPLSKREIKRLEGFEEVIKVNFKGFVAVGNALAAIRDERLYRDRFSTFERYCKELWDVCESRAYQLIDSARVIENLHNCGDFDESDPQHLLPVNEAQARELASLDPEEQRQVWQRLLEETFIQAKPGKRAKITALSVKKAVLAFKGHKLDVQIDQSTREIRRNNTNFTSEPFNNALDSFFEQIKAEKEQNWRNTSRKEAFRLIHGLLEVVGQAGPNELKEMGCAMELSDREKLKKAGFRLFRMDGKDKVIEEWYRGEEWVVAETYPTAKAMSDGFKELLEDPQHLKG